MSIAEGVQVENGAGNDGWRFSSCWRGCASRSGKQQQLENAGELLRIHGHSRNTMSTVVMVLAAMLVHLAFDAPGTALTVLVSIKGQALLHTNSWLILDSHASNVLVFCIAASICVFSL